MSLYCLNITPQEELDKLSVPRETIFVFRDRGTGRPTKKERRELDGLMDELYYDEGVGAHPAAGPRHAGNGYPPPLKTPPEGGRPAIPPTARRSASEITPHSPCPHRTARFPRRNCRKRQDSCGIQRKNGRIIMQARYPFPFLFAGRHLF